MRNKCTIDGCDRDQRGRGFCDKHYQVDWRKRHPIEKKVKPCLPCSVEGCNLKRRKYGYCEKHLWKSDREKERSKRRYAANREKERLRSAMKNKRTVDARAKKYLQNKATVNAQHAVYRKNNREVVNAIHARYRAKKRGSIGAHSGEEVKRLFGLQMGRCAVCKGKLPRKYHKDHIVPISAGGSNWITNIQLLCPTCNCSKRAKDPIEFMQQKGFLL